MQSPFTMLQLYLTNQNHIIAFIIVILKEKRGRPGRPSSLTFSDPLEVDYPNRRIHAATFSGTNLRKTPGRRDAHAYTLSALEPLREDELRKQLENRPTTIRPTSMVLETDVDEVDC